MPTAAGMLYAAWRVWLFWQGLDLPMRTIREWIGAAVQVVVHLERCGGERRIQDVTLGSGARGRSLPYYPVLLLGESRTREGLFFASSITSAVSWF